MGSRGPDLFIIGAPKCGTTSMYHYLAGHPQIYMSPRKEPRYFAPDLHSGAEGKNFLHGRDLNGYLDLFAAARDEKRRGEASVRYLYSREAPRLIREFEPRPYLVAMLRDPVEMMHSLHRHMVAGGSEPITDFEHALAAEAERASLGDALHQYRARARFGEQLQRWFAVFPRARIHVLILEEFVRAPEQHFSRLLEFLEVDPAYRPASFEARNARHEPRSAAVRSAMRSKPAQWVMWRLLPRVLGQRRQRRALSPFSQFNRREAEKVRLHDDMRRPLELELSDDVRLLSALLGRDMAAFWWGTSADPVEAGTRLEAAAQTGSP